jgi:hypothetical protein
MLAQVDPRKLRIDLQTCFKNIFLEAGFRGKFSKRDLPDAFEGGDRKKLAEIMKSWEETYPIGIQNMRDTFGDVFDGPFSPEEIASTHDDGGVCVRCQA